MTVIAFLYTDYDKYSPRNCYCGTWDDAEEAIVCIKGSKYNTNLDVYNLHNGEWHTYRWKTTYKEKRFEQYTDARYVELWLRWQDYDKETTEKKRFNWVEGKFPYGSEYVALSEAGTWERSRVDYGLVEYDDFWSD